jgi:hypothetical protein
MVKMPHNSGRNRRRYFNGGGGTRRRLQCRCGWHGVYNSKRDLKTGARLHAKHCTTMQANLKTVLATEWPQYEHTDENPMNRAAAWQSTSIQAFSSAQEDVVDLVSTDSSEPSESQPPAAPVFSANYLPGDSVIERRVAEQRTNEPMSEDDHRVIQNELVAYVAQSRAEQLAESIARNRGVFYF